MPLSAARSRPHVGRFAPSPTGPLHLGSLLTAVASYLHARQSGGEWLVRIEDIDPPREMPGAAASILKSLEAMELHWDRDVLHQSARLDVHAATAERLLAQGLAFSCSCSRSELRALAGKRGGPVRYPGTCRERRRHIGPTALRMRVDDAIEPIEDALQGPIRADTLTALGDYVIWRRDGLPAYHLAVVVDDDFQGVTTIVRGKDLLDSTAAQQHLRRALGLPSPDHLHVPVVVDGSGRKLSKQTGAQPIDAWDRSLLARTVLSLLGAAPPDELRGASPGMLWEWAQAHWRIEGLKGVDAVPDRPRT